MLDANSAYDVPTAIAAARAYEPFEIRWFEEPVAWFDPVFGLARVGEATSIPLASGERELHRFGCRDLDRPHADPLSSSTAPGRAA